MWWPVLLASVVASVTGLCVACPGSVWLARVVCGLPGLKGGLCCWPALLAHVVACVPGPRGGLCSWPTWWPVLLVHVSGHAAGLGGSRIAGQ